MYICSCMKKLWWFTQKIKIVVGEGVAASRAGVRITFLCLPVLYISLFNRGGGIRFLCLLCCFLFRLLSLPHS